ncbi:hypothetical protein IQ254_07055 [Nodosilinea sp. LEGE 07088]|uniref:hypothetical protein n=1 Tax=Nodosilinea sp. LEGE 07088 TaxID=2777968 RepID=UPI0018820EBE|nr:hypothetical protein [Nodosilinea sp. LEGE 07088]MBE9136961.1 hypothetical protein [Nodosilinea sp. LEGE 07088]
MIDTVDRQQLQLGRQVAHWTMAALRLSDLDDLASPSAWNSLENYLGLVLRQNLAATVDRLQRQAAALQSQWNGAKTAAEFQQVEHHLLEFRQRYLRTETLLDFYADAINTRTNSSTAALLRACDVLARRSMAALLDQLGLTAPPVLTYLDKGLGASILKAGLRLWDGRTESLVAAIKIVRHNLYRPTALIHEAGHQVAHAVGWSKELAAGLEHQFGGMSPKLGRLWASWASEIAADAYAFVHTGYASVAGLHDVLAGGPTVAFRYMPGDPHPISYLRVLLGVEMCRLYFGPGPWDDLADQWSRSNRWEEASAEVQTIIPHSLPWLPHLAKWVLTGPLRAFRGAPLAALIDPRQVSPEALAQLQRRGSNALYTSHHWIWTESLRLLALSGYRAATEPHHALEILQQQKDWMLRLGETLKTV